jgi:hypothetical protein
MEYAWLTLEGCGDQETGFFVDENDRILYWPEEEAPGFVVNLETAEILCNLQFTWGKWGGMALGVGIAICIVLLFFSGSYYSLVDRYFSEDVWPIASVCVFFYLWVLLVFIFVPYFKRKATNRVLEVLRDSEQLEEVSPKPQFLKPSATDGRIFIWFGVPCFGLLGIAGIFGAFYQYEMIGDRLVFMPICLLMIIGAGFMLWREIAGLRVDQVRVYQAAKNSPGNS